MPSVSGDRELHHLDQSKSIMSVREDSGEVGWFGMGLHH